MQNVSEATSVSVLGDDVLIVGGGASGVLSIDLTEQERPYVMSESETDFIVNSVDALEISEGIDGIIAGGTGSEVYLEFLEMNR